MSPIEAVERLERIGFEAIKRPDLKPVKVDTPFDWSVDPFKDENWMFQFHTLRWIRPYIASYKATNRAYYFRKAFEIVEDWYRSDVKPESVVWGDMATGIRSEVIYELYEAVNGVDQLYENFCRIVDIAKSHYEVLLRPGFINTRHNHALFALHGLKSLNKIFEEEKTERYIENNFVDLLDRQFDKNGVHTEHSPHYHYFITAMIEKYMKTGWYNDMDCVSERVELFKENKAGLVCHRGFELPFGDTDNNSKPSGYSLPSEEVGAFMFCKSGYSVARGRDGVNMFTVAQTNNRNSHTHKHSDNLSIIWALNKEEILVDPGKYSYNKNDPARNKVLSPRYHNTVVVDDFEWGYRDIKPLECSLVDLAPGVLSFSSSLEISRNKKEKYLVDRKVDTDGFSFMTITDKCSGDGKVVRGRLYFHPDSSIEYISGGYKVSLREINIVVAFDGAGISTTIAKGVYSPSYGVLRDAPGIEYLFHDEVVVGLKVERPCDD